MAKGWPKHIRRAHFAFMYFLFVGPDGVLPDADVQAELRAIFLPLWPALVVLIVLKPIVDARSHRREHGAMPAKVLGQRA